MVRRRPGTRGVDSRLLVTLSFIRVGCRVPPLPIRLAPVMGAQVAMGSDIPCLDNKMANHLHGLLQPQHRRTGLWRQHSGYSESASGPLPCWAFPSSRRPQSPVCRL